MVQTLEDCVWVFVGCGGTFYAASPYLAVLGQRYCKRRSVLIDPDRIEGGDEHRQWPGSMVGVEKVDAAGWALGGCIEERSHRIVEKFQADDKILGEETDGRSVLAIVNVDNDQARLDVADWLESRMNLGIMVVSGCERTFGQCYPGIWDNGEAICDWREHHKDVGQGGPPQGQCNAQDIRANALTGVLVGMCIEDIAQRLQDWPPKEIREFYWKADGTGVHMWDMGLRIDGGYI